MLKGVQSSSFDSHVDELATIEPSWMLAEHKRTSSDMQSSPPQRSTSLPFSDPPCSAPSASSLSSKSSWCSFQLSLYGLLALIILVLSVVLPIVSASYLNHLIEHHDQILSRNLRNIITWSHICTSIDGLRDSTRIYSYLQPDTARRLFGDLITAVNSGESQTSAEQLLQLRQQFAKLQMIGLTEEDAVDELNEATDQLEASFPAFVREVEARNQRQQQQRHVRENFRNIVEPMYQVSHASVTSRAQLLLSQAMLACVDVEGCVAAGGIERLQPLQVLVGRIMTCVMSIIVDVLEISSIPAEGSTTLRELIRKSSDRNTARADMLDYVSSQTALLATEVESIIDVSHAATMAERFIVFVTPNTWPAQMIQAVEDAVSVAANISTFYTDSEPAAQWLRTGAEAELGWSAQLDEVLAAAQSFSSVFSYDIGTSLEINLTEQQRHDIAVAFHTAPMEQSLNQLKDIALAGQQDAFVAASAATASHHDSTIFLWVVLIIIMLLTVAMYVLMLFLLRHQVAASPLSFTNLVIILAILGAIQLCTTARAGYVAINAKTAPLQLRLGTIQGMIMPIFDLVNASNIISHVLSNALLISPTEEQWHTYAAEAKSAAATLLAKPQSRSWWVDLGHFLERANSLFGSGFYPLRQQMTAYSSLGLTMDAVYDGLNVSPLLDFVTLTNKDDVVPQTGCASLMSGTVMSSLAPFFIDLDAVAENLIHGELIQPQQSAIYSNSFQSVCQLMSSVARECYLAPFCGPPVPTLGLLRDPDGRGGLYQVFDASSRNSLGPLLRLWRTLDGQLAAEMVNFERRFDLTTKMDDAFVDAMRRECIWIGIFTCITLEVGFTVVWLLLYGVPIIIP